MGRGGIKRVSLIQQLWALALESALSSCPSSTLTVWSWAGYLLSQPITSFLMLWGWPVITPVRQFAWYLAHSEGSAHITSKTCSQRLSLFLSA